MYNKLGRPIFHLDLHTGIGAYGTCHLLTFESADDPRTIILQSKFGSAVTPLGFGLISNGEPSGIMVNWLAHHFASQNKVYKHLIAEYGTHPSLRAFKALYQENRFHEHPGPKRESAKKELMEIFCPQDPAWREKCVTEGLRLISKALED